MRRVYKPSETKYGALFIRPLLSNFHFLFQIYPRLRYPWIVGVTDGDGTLSKNFYIAQSCYNLRLLYFIKNSFNLGSI